MADRATRIKNATIKARNEWVDFTVKQERQLLLIMQQSADEIMQQVERATVEGKVPMVRLNRLYANIEAEIAALRPKMTRNIRRGMSRSVDYGMKTGIKSMEAAQLPARFKIHIGSSFIGKDGQVRRYNPIEEAYADSAWAKINRDAMEALIRFQPGGITLSSRVWDITWNAEKAIRNRIQMAVLTGESAGRLSRDIRGFLAEPRKLFRRRKVDGKLVLSGPAREYHPGTGVYRSSYKNALRVSRTELGRAYTEGTFRYANQKDWIKGYIFRTASGAPCPICQDYDGEFFPKDSPPPITVHPNCYCYAELVLDEEKIG